VQDIGWVGGTAARDRRGQSLGKNPPGQKGDRTFHAQGIGRIQTSGQRLDREPAPSRQELAKKILVLRDSFLKASASESRGKSVFQKNCAACHSIGSEGATVGPQLDGIGRRGVERLLEDILDPDRNVDAAFSTINIATKEGEIFSGLKVSDDAQAIELVDSQAKKHRIPRNEIEQVKPSRLSPMPSGLAQVMKQEEIHDLLAYLISTSGPTE